MRRRNRGGRKFLAFWGDPGTLLAAPDRVPVTTPERRHTPDVGHVAAVDQELCVRCGQCAQVCPAQAITLDSYGKPRVNEGLCRGCGACINECPVGALRLVLTQPTGQGMSRSYRQAI
jgi:MinD superfamily P-loop ATPase